MTTDGLPDGVSPDDVLEALVTGCRSGHGPSVDAARAVLRGLSEGGPLELADCLEALREMLPPGES